MHWLNHNISKQLVSIAKQLNAALAFEDLANIRESLNQKPTSKTQRRRTNNWAFYQLRLFVGYKASGDTIGHEQAAQDSDWLIAAKASITLKNREITA